MSKFYVHVRLFEPTKEQEQKFEAMMPNFSYSKTFIEDDIEFKLLPGAYIIQSSLNSKQILDQVSSIASSVDLNANVFVCAFNESDSVLSCSELSKY